MSHLARLVRHNTWANQTWIGALDTVAPEDEYLRRTLSHILRAERVWLQRIAGEAPAPDLWSPLSPIEFDTLQTRHAASFVSLLDGDLDRIVSYRRFAGQRYQSSVADILMHLCTHGAHHRGQMAAYASGRGMAAPPVDFLNFCIATGV